METWSIISLCAATLTVIIGLYSFWLSFSQKFRIREVQDRRLSINNLLTTENLLIQSVERSTRRIDILGVRLHNILFRPRSRFLASILNASHRGVKVRILVADPESDVYGPIYERGAKVPFWRRKEYIDTIKDLLRSEYARGNLEVHLYLEPVPYFIVLVDDLLCVSERDSAERSYDIINDPGDHIYLERQEQFEAIWDEGSELIVSR